MSHSFETEALGFQKKSGLLTWNLTEHTGVMIDRKGVNQPVRLFKKHNLFDHVITCQQR